MLNAKEKMEIQMMGRQGISILEISHQVRVSFNAVLGYLRATNVAQRGAAHATVAQARSVLASYIRRQLYTARPNWPPATVLLREISAQSYGGGSSRIHDFIRGLCAVRLPGPLLQIQ
jgi:transposase